MAESTISSFGGDTIYVIASILIFIIECVETTILTTLVSYDLLHALLYDKTIMREVKSIPFVII